MADQISVPLLRAVDRNGEPQAGAKRYTYISGTMIALTVTDEDGVALPWPQEADGNGVFAQFFYDGAEQVKVIVTDADDVVLPGYPVDPCMRVPAVETQAENLSFTATTNVPESDVQAAIEHVGDRLADLAAAGVTDGGLVTVTGTIESGLEITVTKSTEAQAEAGTDDATAMTPLRTANAIAALSPLGAEYASAAQTITSAGALTLAHGLGERPKLVAFTLTCVTDEAGYVTGEVIAVDFNSTSTSDNRVNTAKLTTSNIVIRFSDQTNCFVVAHATTGVGTALTNTSWTLGVRAWA
jgi:hypothetical protein